MSETVENGIKFDRTFWPEGGTAVPAIPADLETIWDTHPDQGSVFVAEALIGGGHRITAHFWAQEDAKIEIYLWSVGGDTLTVSFDLKTELADSVSDYLQIRSEAQAEEAATIVQGLQTLEDAIRRERSKLEDKLKEFRKAAV